jgi:hypothetical protein
MGSLLIAAVLVLALMLLLAMFAKGGPTETISTTGLPPELAGMGALQLPELASVTDRLFTELGFSTLSRHERPDRVDLTMQDPTPVTGQTLYIRCILSPPDGAIQSAEVQAAMDAARGENLAKAVVVSSGIFSDEAQLVSRNAPLELIDGRALAGLLRTHLPDVANRLGVPR